MVCTLKTTFELKPCPITHAWNIKMNGAIFKLEAKL